MTLEELLNKLIEKGWKPFGDIGIANFNHVANVLIASDYDNKVIGQPKIRQIASKESGLWQFVCENNLVDYDTESWWWEFSYNSNHINWFYGKKIFESNYQYRLIESSLRYEFELEGFILDNIKIEW